MRDTYVTYGRCGVFDRFVGFTTASYIFVRGCLIAANIVLRVFCALKGKKFHPYVLVLKSLPPDLKYYRYNILNGTMVCIYGDTVLKFYFKSIEYYARLYKSLAVVASWRVFERENFLLVHDQFFGGANYSGSFDCLSESGEYVMLRNIEKLPSDFHIRNIFYSLIDRNVALESQTKIELSGFFEYLSGLVSAGDYRVNHGDLWSDNILELDGYIKIVDYDKVVFAPYYYDYAYFNYMVDDTIRQANPVVCLLSQLDMFNSGAYRRFSITLDHWEAFLFVLLVKSAELKEFYGDVNFCCAKAISEYTHVRELMGG